MALGLAPEALRLLAMGGRLRLVRLRGAGEVPGAGGVGLELLAMAADLGADAVLALGAAGALSGDGARGDVGERGDDDQCDDDDDDGLHGSLLVGQSPAVGLPARRGRQAGVSS